MSNVVKFPFDRMPPRNEEDPSPMLYRAYFSQQCADEMGCYGVIKVRGENRLVKYTSVDVPGESGAVWPDLKCVGEVVWGRVKTEITDQERYSVLESLPNEERWGAFTFLLFLGYHGRGKYTLEELKKLRDGCLLLAEEEEEDN